VANSILKVKPTHVIVDVELWNALLGIVHIDELVE
jgi:hypothetical protein